MTNVDVVVVGLGAMGSAAAWQLAGRGRRVVGVEQHHPLHTLGSSHGAARIFRVAYEEDEYVALAVEAQRLWRRLEEETGTQIMFQTGALDYGAASVLGRIAAALDRANLGYEELTPDQARARWDGIAFDGPVLFSPDGGRTDADLARESLQQRAAALGADLRFGTRVLRVADSGTGGVRVETEQGDIEADVAVVTVNAWANAVVDDLPSLRVTQEQPAFFRTRDPQTVWPSFVRYEDDDEPHTMSCYGVASPAEGGVKVGEHGTGPMVDPDAARPDVDPIALERLSHWVSQHLPGLDPLPLGATRCLYATTPDSDFVLDRRGAIVIGAGFSGHGFKFTPAIGRVLADLADGVAVPAPRFRVSRPRAFTVEP